MNFFVKSGSLSRQRHITGWLLLVPMFMALMVNYLLPFVIAFIRSFYRGMGNTFVGMENYVELLQNQTFLLAFTGSYVYGSYGQLSASVCYSVYPQLLPRHGKYLRGDGKLCRTVAESDLLAGDP